MATGSGDLLNMRCFNTRECSPAQIVTTLRRAVTEYLATHEAHVRSIIEDVQRRGDDAVVDYERQFGWAGCTARAFCVPCEEMDVAWRELSANLRDTLLKAKERLQAYHSHRLPTSRIDRTMDGSIYVEIAHPIESVAIYVPGGRAAYPSTVLHVGVPARAAGVRKVYITTPPDDAGRVHPAVLAAAKLIEADAVFRIGGAHALAAFAFGTASIPKVDMLAGPGGSYVVVAKRLLYGVVGVDLLPGPSEIFIIADESADPFIVASDMLAQAEHGEDSVAILATPEDELIDATREALVKLLESSPRRKLIAQALSQFGAFIRTRNLDEAVEICNQYAPEHVELLVADAFTTAMSIQHAGAVFIGANSPVVAGDYMAGPSHVLPTGGAARFLSGLSPATFTKCVHYVALSREDMEGLADAVMQFAELEGLHCHANAMRLRLTHFNAPKAVNKGGC